MYITAKEDSCVIESFDLDSKRMMIHSAEADVDSPLGGMELTLTSTLRHMRPRLRVGIMQPPIQAFPSETTAESWPESSLSTHTPQACGVLGDGLKAEGNSKGMPRTLPVPICLKPASNPVSHAQGV